METAAMKVRMAYKMVPKRSSSEIKEEHFKWNPDVVPQKVKVEKNPLFYSSEVNQAMLLMFFLYYYRFKQDESKSENTFYKKVQRIFLFVILYHCTALFLFHPLKVFGVSRIEDFQLKACMTTGDLLIQRKENVSQRRTKNGRKSCKWLQHVSLLYDLHHLLPGITAH